MTAQFVNGAPLIVRLPGIPQPELSPSGNGYIYFDVTSGKFMASENGGMYVPLIGGGATPTLAAVLAAGNVSGSNDILVSSGQKIDIAAPGALNLGTTTATTVVIGSGTTGISLQGTVTTTGDVLVPPANKVDTTAAGSLNLGTANATSFALGSTAGTQQVFINQGGVALHGSGSGVQYSSITASRSQYRVNQYGNNAGVPGISTFKSRGATVGSLSAVLDGDVIFRDTAVGVCGDNASIPLSGMISIQVPTGGSVPGQNWIATEFQVQLVPLEGPINGRKEMFRVTSQGVLCVRETANRMAGTATLDAVGTAVVANTSVKATTKFNLTVQDGGPAPTGVVYQSARVVNTSFTITSSAGAADAGVVVYYQLWEPTIP